MMPVPDVPGDELFQTIVSQHPGKAVFFDLWATWCGPCMKGIEKMEPLKEELKEKDIVFVYITDESSPLAEWSEQVLKIPGLHYRVGPSIWPLLFGPKDATRVNISIPQYYLYNRQGERVWEELGFNDEVWKPSKKKLAKHWNKSQKNTTMQGNFSYYNPTKLYFGDESLNFLKDELKNYGPTVLLNYGSGSVKRNGIYDEVVAILKAAGKTIVENPGVMSNPTLEKMHEGIKIARDNNVDWILSLGGGSVCDYSKGVAASVFYEGDYWEKFWLKQENPDEGQKILPIGCILTMAGTGSEMNGGSVITDEKNTFKVGHVFDSRLMPKFSILNPKYTMTVPENQMKAGIYDIMNHIMEQYFSDFDDNTSDYLSEGLMRSLVHSSRIAVKNPQDYEARSNIMWTATWALNTLIGLGKQEDWMVHMIGHSVGAWTHAPHGYALASVSMAYYRRAMKNGLPKFVRFAKNVWNIQGDGMTDEQIAEAGLEALKNWMLEVGLPLTIGELGATEEMIPGITETTVVYPAGYLNLSKADVAEILKESLS